MRSATLLTTSVRAGAIWQLWRLSTPLMGFCVQHGGHTAHLAVWHVLTIERDGKSYVIESNDRGQVVAWGSWPKSESHSAAMSLANLGYQIAEAA